MKKELVNIIKILGIGLTELIIDIELDSIIINSIEWSPIDKKIYLHVFEDIDNLDIEIDFDDLSEENQQIIFKKLSQITYN